MNEVTHIEMGQSPPSETYNESAVGLPFFQGKAEFGSLFPEVRKYCNKPIKIAEKFDILLSVRAPIGPTNLAPGKCCIGRGLAAIRPMGSIPYYFIFYFLRLIRNELEAKGTGSTFSAISSKELSKVTVPLPPLAEQHRIVAKIEELFSDLDAGIDSLKKAKELLTAFRGSTLQIIFDGIDPVNGYETDTNTHSIQEIVTEIGQGWSPQCEYENAEDASKWAVIKTTAIQGMKFHGYENKILPVGLEPRKHLELREGDFLITRSGPRNRVGVSCVVRLTRPKLLLCDKAYRLVLKKEIVSPEYLELLLNSPEALDKINKIKTGISDSGVNLTQNRFLELRVKIPKIEIQKKWISEIGSRLSEADNLEKTLDAALAQAESLRQSILKQAFEGKLVPQDPDDEPAEKLLERIRAERAANAGAPKKRGRYGGGVAPAKAGGNGTPVEGGAPKPRRGRPPGKKATAAVKAKRRG